MSYSVDFCSNRDVGRQVKETPVTLGLGESIRTKEE